MNIFILFCLIHFYISPCPVSDTLCLRCGGDRCLDCADSYPNDSGTCIKIRNQISNCISYDSFDFCSKCDFTYKLVNGQCEKIPAEDKCAQQDVNGDCKYCMDGLLMKDGQCKSDNSKCSIANCLLCSNYYDKEQCEICKDNFVVYPYGENSQTKTKCIHENGRTIGCQISSYEDERECLLCRVKFYFSEGKCILSPDYDIETFVLSSFKILKIIFVFMIIFQ